MLELLRQDKIKEAYDYYQINVEEERKRLEKLESEAEAEKVKE